MPRRFPCTASGYRIVLLLTFCLLFLQISTSHAVLSCNPQGYSSIIGTELVAVQCIPDGMNDNMAISYRYRDYECIGGVVTKTSEDSTVVNAPHNIAYPTNGMGGYFRHFRNQEGSYFLDVSTWYRGTIDGKSMSLSAYPGGGVYTDVFTEIIDPSSLPPVPDCQGGDANRPLMELCGNSTVNIGTGRLSHSQEIFATKSSQPLALSVSLFYRSIEFAPSAIGNGWSHSYETSLRNGAGNSMVFWHEGKRRIYNNYNGTYVSPKDDYSTLVKHPDNTFTITEKDGFRRNFDTAGVATSIIDRNNNSLTFGYDNGKLTSVTDPNGRSATFSCDGNGNLSTITDPGKNLYTFGYGDGKLTSLTHPDAGQWIYTYGTNGLLSTKRDPENNSVSYIYDDNNRLASTNDPVGKDRSYAFPAPAANKGF